MTTAGWINFGLIVVIVVVAVATGFLAFYTDQRMSAMQSTMHVTQADVLSTGTALESVNRPTDEFPRVLDQAT